MTLQKWSGTSERSGVRHQQHGRFQYQKTLKSSFHLKRAAQRSALVTTDIASTHSLSVLKVTAATYSGCLVVSREAYQTLLKLFVETDGVGFAQKNTYRQSSELRTVSMKLLQIEGTFFQEYVNCFRQFLILRQSKFFKALKTICTSRQDTTFLVH